MKYNEKLVALRKANGMTQQGFASAVGVTRQAVYKWEVGDSYPEAEKLIAIKALFGISIDDLLDDSFDVVVEIPKKPSRRRTVKPFTPAETPAEEAPAPVIEEAPAAVELPFVPSVEEVPAPIVEEAPAPAPAPVAPAAMPAASAASDEDDEFDFTATDTKKEGVSGDIFGMFRKN